MRKMCSKNDKNHDEALRQHPTTKTTPITKRRDHPHQQHEQYDSTSDDCMWWDYQPKPNYLSSSSTVSCSSNATAKTNTTTTTFNSTNCWSRRRRRQLQQQLCHLLTPLLAIVLVASLCDNCVAAPQSCTLCDREDLKAQANPHESNYEEFLFEHQVTRQDAVNALRALNDSFYIGPSPDNSCKSVTCSNKVMRYCLGPQFINDHCWCELGHTDEGLPYIPHICYVGEKVYSASVGSCFFYEEVKECCCAPALAKQWRHISAAPLPFTLKMYLRLVMAAVLLVFVAASN